MDIETSRFLTIVVFTIVVMAIMLAYKKMQEKKRYKNGAPAKPDLFDKDPGGNLTEIAVREKLNELFGIRPAVSVLLPAGDISTEVDLVQATTKGIFVVECKARKQSITGNAKADYWKIGSEEKAIRMENPIKQNFYHAKALKQYFGTKIEDVPVHNIVVILSRTVHVYELDSVTEARIFTDLDEIEVLKKLPNVISNEQAKELQEMFYEKEGTIEELKKHAEKVRKKFQNMEESI